MKIKEVTHEHILFDNGNTITFNHEQGCCEFNFADFEALDDIARNAEFNEELLFEAVKGSGFRFGNTGKMFFVPCYSCQNGWYTEDVDIYYNGIRVLRTLALLDDKYDYYDATWME